MIQFEQFTGGVFDTNAFLIRGPAGTILIDAPQGADQRFATGQIDFLILTHGHIDHITDAAAIQNRHGCQVGCHSDTVQMVTNRDFFRDWGFGLEADPVQPGFLIQETAEVGIAGLSIQIFEVPGHCPGSICLYLTDHGLLFGGDVLFRGGIGRWDLPGGDHELLVNGIRSKLFPLPDATRVLAGHGPETSIAREKTTNPWLQI